jgi:hypothetical protein
LLAIPFSSGQSTAKRATNQSLSNLLVAWVVCLNAFFGETQGTELHKEHSQSPWVFI